MAATSRSCLQASEVIDHQIPVTALDRPDNGTSMVLPAAPAQVVQPTTQAAPEAEAARAPPPTPTSKQQKGTPNKVANKSTPKAAAQPKPVARVAGSRMPPEVKAKLTAILDELCSRDTFKTFQKPVKKAVAPDYNLYIKEPIDFKKIRTRMKNGEYSSPSDFERVRHWRTLSSLRCSAVGLQHSNSHMHGVLVQQNA